MLLVRKLIKDYIGNSQNQRKNISEITNNTGISGGC